MILWDVESTRSAAVICVICLRLALINWCVLGKLLNQLFNCCVYIYTCHVTSANMVDIQIISKMCSFLYIECEV